MKKCTKCKVFFSIDCFHNDCSKKDGKHSSCRECSNSPDRKLRRVLNKNKKREYDKDRYEKHRDATIEKSKKYYENNKEKIFKYYKERSKSDLSFKLKKRLRSRIYKALKGNQKRGSVINDLGRSIEYLKSHLQKSFYDNPKTGEVMNWENYGNFGWHIDHIVSLKELDLTNPHFFKKACHYTNLQPLRWFDNLAKG